jgi:hypothetical protein
MSYDHDILPALGMWLDQVGRGYLSHIDLCLYLAGVVYGLHPLGLAAE